MGAGKSTVGKKLARKLGKEFHDTDKAIEKKSGVDIATIFEFEGEKGFRVREEKIIADLCDKQDIVLATGGGAVLSENTRKIISNSGVIYYLKATVETLVSRTKNDAKRPLLLANDKAETISKLLDQREPLYESIADHIISTDKHTTTWAMNQILKTINT